MNWFCFKNHFWCLYFTANIFPVIRKGVLLFRAAPELNLFFHSLNSRATARKNYKSFPDNLSIIIYNNKISTANSYRLTETEELRGQTSRSEKVSLSSYSNTTSTSSSSSDDKSDNFFTLFS